MAFTKFNRATNDGYEDWIWVHDRAHVWVVRYSAGERYEAYRSIVRVPKGRRPWAVNNKRISNGDFFPTLAAAMEAAEVVAGQSQDNAKAE